jgi:hypothetical protein
MSAEPRIQPGMTAEEEALVRQCLAPVGTRPATALQVAERIDALARAALAAPA